MHNSNNLHVGDLEASFGSLSFSSSSSLRRSSSSAFASPSSSGRADPSLPVVLENGRKVFGPPCDFVGARPTYLCELFIAHVPQHLDEVNFLMWLQRCGSVYEFRLMMNSGNATRGYGFVRFMRESDALAACEMLGFHFINGERLRVFRSQGKNRLYVSNIPNGLPIQAMTEGFQKIFREMQRCTIYPGTEENRGYAFIEFQDHEGALEAKKRTTPGRVRMWGCDLKVQWAKPKRTNLSHRRLFSDTQTNNSAQLQPCLNDYCAKLRLFCLANNWCIPVVVYGRSFREYGVQYGGILLGNAVTGQHSCVLMEVDVEQVCDIHVLMCEVAVQLIELSAGFPPNNYVLRIWGGSHAESLFSFKAIYQLEVVDLSDYLVSSTALVELAKSMDILSQYHPEILLRIYRNSFLQEIPAGMPTMDLDAQEPLAKFYTIFPKFRNNPPLNNSFNDTEIVMMQAMNLIPMSRQNHQQMPLIPNCTRQNIFRLKSQHSLTMAHTVYTLRYVDVLQVGNYRWFYHSLQDINSHPVWILGHTYQRSIFKLT